MRHRPLGLLLLGLLPLSSCCSLARLFCGPDRSQWVSERYDSPTRAVATFLEAIRRDDADVASRCFTQDCLKRLGLDAFTVQVAWQQLRDQNPGMHLLGYAEVPAPKPLTATAATFDLQAEGVHLHLDLVCESFWELTYLRENRTVGGGLHPIASWSELARIEGIKGADPETSRLVIEPLVFDHEGVRAVPLDTIESAGLVRRWKISGFRVQPAP